MDILGRQIVVVGAAREHPQQLFHHWPGIDPFGGDERESVGQVPAHLQAEQAPSAGARAVAAVDALLHDFEQGAFVGVVGVCHWVVFLFYLGALGANNGPLSEGFLTAAVVRDEQAHVFT